MTRELRCKATTTAGNPCGAPSNVVDPKTSLCPAHAPGGREKLSEAGRKGGEAMARRLKRRGLEEGDLPALNSPEAAEIWLEKIGRAVATGRLGHQEGRSATAAVQQWLKAHEAGRMADRLEALREQLEAVRSQR